MNREQALELARLAKAFADGETLQIYIRQQGLWVDWDPNSAIQIGDPDPRWRIKPKAPEPLEGWANVYGEGWLVVHTTAEEAQRKAGPGAIRVAVHLRGVTPAILYPQNK